MGRAIDLFVTYRFIKLLVTPFEKQDAYKLGIIDKNGNRITIPNTSPPRPTPLDKIEERTHIQFYTNLFSTLKSYLIKFQKNRTKLGTYTTNCSY